MVEIDFVFDDWMKGLSLTVDRVPCVGEKICVQEEPARYNDFIYTIYEVIDVAHVFSFSVSTRAAVRVKKIANDVDFYQWMREQKE